MALQPQLSSSHSSVPGMLSSDWIIMNAFLPLFALGIVLLIIRTAFASLCSSLGLGSLLLLEQLLQCECKSLW